MHYISLYEATNPSKGYNKTKGTKREKYYHNEPTVFIDLDAYGDIYDIEENTVKPPEGLSKEELYEWYGEHFDI